MTPPLNGLKLWYDMETLTGGLMKDLSGNGKDGTLWGPPPIVAGHLGNGRLFTQPNHLNTTASGGSETGFKYTGGELTLMCWVRINSTEVDGGKIISKPWNGSGQYNYWVSVDASKRLQVHLHGTTIWDSPLGSALVPGKDTHLALVLRSDASVLLYKNGSNDITTTHTISGWVPSSGDTNVALSIGTLYPYAAATNPPVLPAHAFDGMIDEVLVYDRALSLLEIIDYIAALPLFKLRRPAKAKALRNR